MYSETNNVNEKHKLNIKDSESNLDLDLECYIIPYNESYEYVFIGDIINTLRIKNKIQNVKKCCVTKRWFHKQELDPFKYAIHFSCDNTTMKSIKDELITRHLWIRKLEQQHINQLKNNEYFSQ